MIEVIIAVISVLLGVGGTFAYEKQRQYNTKSKVEKELASAKTKAGDIVLQAKDEAIKLENERRHEWKKTESRLAEREDALDKKMDELDRRSEKLRGEERDVENLKDEIRDIRTKQQEKLEREYDCMLECSKHREMGGEAEGQYGLFFHKDSMQFTEYHRQEPMIYFEL